MRIRVITMVAAVVASTLGVAAGAEARVEAVPPGRILDTRSGLGSAPGRVGPGDTIALAMTAERASGATAVTLNLTATDAVDAGYVTAWPCGTSMPETSIVNFVPGHPSANFVAVGIGDGGVCLSASQPVHLVADLMGWFDDGDFRALAPDRLLDTRRQQGPFATGQERRIDVAPDGADAASVALNVTVVEPDADGYVTVYPCGARPLASSVNFRVGEVVPTFVMVPSPGGEVCIYASARTHLVVDRFGRSPRTDDLALQSPARLLDTRTGFGGAFGAAGPSGRVEVRVAGRGGVANDAAAALVTVTATGGQADGYVTAWGCAASRPTASVLNLRPGLLGSNLALVPLSAAGTLCLYAWTVDGSSVHLVLDAVGAVAGGPDRPPPPPDPVPAPPPPPVPPPAPGPGYFSTLPVGAPLPSDAQCATAVRDAPENRPGNTSFNQTRGSGPPANPPAPLYARVTGNFTGTTDEIIQWGACKWGIDEDIVRAQTARESWWQQSTIGDNGESFGVLQVRQPYWGWAFPSARTSTAYNLDAALAARRNCFEGNETWLHTVSGNGGTYQAGDLWGCVGLWFAGRWKSGPANTYTAEVQQYLAQRVWAQPNF